MAEWFESRENAEILVRLCAALAIGALIGIERSYHGRPAGFRTHALVCLSTSLLMLVAAYQTAWFPDLSRGRIMLDPTRMAQGIMTGIGFLGAGTIIREGPTVRGLTTAASIWMTAAIGVLVGIGFYFPAGVATVLTLGTLSVFGWMERIIPSHSYAQLAIRFRHDGVMPESEIRALLTGHGFQIANLSYRLDVASGFFEYGMVVHTRNLANSQELSRSLVALDTVSEFRISPVGD